VNIFKGLFTPMIDMREFERMPSYPEYAWVRQQCGVLYGEMITEYKALYGHTLGEASGPFILTYTVHYIQENSPLKVWTQSSNIEIFTIMIKRFEKLAEIVKDERKQKTVRGKLLRWAGIR
jgi:hypothetical protein